MCECVCVKVTRRGEKIPEGCECRGRDVGAVSRERVLGVCPGGSLGQRVPEQAEVARGGGDR